jgi:hypothetical protein
MKHFEEEVLPQIISSSFILIIMKDRLDSKICLETGAAILLDKPIMLVTASMTLIPKKLKDVVDEIVLVHGHPWNNEDYDAIGEAITRITAKIKGLAVTGVEPPPGV